MPTPIGIDLGTTFSCVATIGPNGEPEAIANFEGANTTPSVVAYSDDEIYVGETAVQSATPTTNIVHDSKRFIGRQFDDVSVQADIKLWPFVVVSNEGKPLVKLTQYGKEKKLAAEEISSEVLKMMKKIAVNYLKEEVTKAVITVPANFDQRQRHATVEAAKLAGIEVIRLINEPTAAAIAYGVHNEGTNNVLVYDLGGGTFDVSIVKCEGDKKLHTIATSGHKHLGGQDFDIIIRDHVLTNFHDFPEDKPRMMKRLLGMCTKAKIGLSSHETATISIDSGDDDVWNMKLTRNKFEELCGAILRGTLDIVDEALHQAKMKESDIDIVILAGGSTRIPMVQDLLKEKFGPEKLWNRHNPDEVVAKGAALVAKSLLRNEPSLQLSFNDIVPLSIGFECRGGLFQSVIEKGTKFPCEKETTSCTAYDNQESVFSGIYEGERADVKNNFKIGEVGLRLEKKKEKQGYKLKETFEIDVNGILHVTTTEIATGNKAEIEICYDGCAHKEMNIEKYVEESLRCAEEDQAFKDLAQTRNSFESTIYGKKRALEKKMNDNKLSKPDGEKGLELLDSYLEWSDDFPQDKNVYAEKLKELESKMDPYLDKILVAWCGNVNDGAKQQSDKQFVNDETYS
ncbi:hypothetical protein WR25_01455 [Diploscapter pachys]|uniref:Uncharacterized protein n=1 Tax=Diploscapter pachys TaxID=2018661 RepID=A0A2A2LUL2_9BILA|nr:hypothetical protein WR25_01455 [Diploscapter pachys]